MENDINLLIELSKRHKEWINIVRSFGRSGTYIPPTVVDDIVQDMYIRMNKYIIDPERVMRDGKVNLVFVYTVLKNIYLNYINTDIKKVAFTQKYYKDTYGTIVMETIQDESTDEIQYIDIQTLEEDIKEYIESWHHYDRKVFKLIFYDGYSMRKLARETGISLTSIFITVKNCKNKIRVKYGKEFNQVKEKI